MFHFGSDLFSIAFRAVAVYLFIILAIRLSGKKELAQLSVIDLVFILLISNAVQNAMVGNDASLSGGLVAAAVLFLVNAGLKWAILRSRRFSKLIQGQPILLVYHGKVQPKNLAKAGLTPDELKEALREHGVRAVEEVDLAVLEVDGNISVLSNEFQERTVHKRRGRNGLSRGQSD
ncbi:uncharacterized protein DUF421 [Hydrogenispora ethanolica]|uniref:Uncharacterized protein DUF421 n=1 Tax=Hydrogenispora ethanolica TaxID=1082276 RepID=A0A4R1RQC8_HYDET|nr:YetF domain-containing protein [Hydrogenispora ethanolica]TCL68504.1 uncharacterized protein DUF421 [Hydrogenispora ethanolica]